MKTKIIKTIIINHITNRIFTLIIKHGQRNNLSILSYHAQGACFKAYRDSLCIKKLNS
jgi:hypothetical protein